MAEILEFQKRYERLNEDQKKAVDLIEGPVLVVAGPGSGKTELLSLRVANILQKTDTTPHSILCITFTDAAVDNMIERLTSIIGETAYHVPIFTFHGFGSYIIQHFPEYFFEGISFKPADEIIQLELLEKIFSELPLLSPLANKDPEGSYIFLADSQKIIGDLKKAGITPEDFLKIINNNRELLEKMQPEVIEFFENNPIIRSKKQIPEIQKLLETFNSHIKENNDIANFLAQTLSDSYEKCLADEKTTHFTEWKKRHISKNDNNQNIIKESTKLEKLFEIAKIYDTYQQELTKQGLFDYDDMLIRVADAMEKYPELRFTLQERFQYIMIDEFQDTNGIQMKLIELLTDSPVNEGKPNILAVGDDDQAVYKFQGAHIGNIIDFHEKFLETEIILLKKNYRSTQNIIDFYLNIIRKGEYRLENKLKNIEKNLVSHKDFNGSIFIKETHDNLSELTWIASEIKKISTENGTPLNEIAVIAPRHKNLVAAAEIFNHAEIPVTYERKSNILEMQHIKELLTILDYCVKTADHRNPFADDLLPDILNFGFWQIPKLEIWKISLAANKNRTNWHSIMLDWPEPKIREIANFLLNLSFLTKELTAEEFLDLLIGNKPLNISDTIEEKMFTSPYRSYYFSSEKRTENPLKYSDLLSQLNSLFKLTRQYRDNHEGTGIGFLLELIALYRKHKKNISDQNLFQTNEQSIHLLTAHGSKGLEFDTVFIINCQEDLWFNKGNKKKIQLPINIPVQKDEHHSDDDLRLAFVALSRAKHNLYLTYHRENDNGKSRQKARILAEHTADETPVNNELLQILAEKQLFKPQIIIDFDEKQLLRNVLRDYKLSPTAFNNYLDLVYCGPTNFVENNLIRFPQAQTPANLYGNAIHAALEKMQKVFNKTGLLPTEQNIREYFEEDLKTRAFNKNDLEKYLEKGLTNISSYYQRNLNNFRPKDLSEVSFYSQGVNISGLPLTGKIDRIRINDDKEIIVYDYKTGRALTYNAKDEKKLWKYRNQLIFYKILIENSRDYSKYRVEHGFLEFIDANPNEDCSLDNYISDQDTDRLKKLITIVYNKILNLDFPDTSGYEPNLNGINLFIEDLLEGNI